MPTYQYRCTECGHFFEQVQSFSDASLTECPECRGALRKVFNAVGVVFKGSGFYKTDSRSSSSSSSPAAASTSSSSESTSTSTSTTSDSKSASAGSGSSSTGSSSTTTSSSAATAG